jgi:hypothetical protein
MGCFIPVSLALFKNNDLTLLPFFMDSFYDVPMEFSAPFPLIADMQIRCSVLPFWVVSCL